MTQHPGNCVTVWLRWSGLALASLLLTGCAASGDRLRSRIMPPQGPVVELTLERVDPGVDAVAAGSVAADGSVWLLGSVHREVLVHMPASDSWRRIPLVDEYGRTLLDPVSIDATGGLSLLVGDRALGRIYRYDRNGALLDVRSIPDPGPGKDIGSLSDGPDGMQLSLGMLAALSGDRFAVVDDAGTRLAYVDEGSGEVRFLDLPLGVGALAAGQGAWVVVDPLGTTLQFVGPHGATERIVDLPRSDLAMDVVDMAWDGRDLFVLSAGGLLLHIQDSGTDTPSMQRLRASPSVQGSWKGLVVLPDAIWWIGTEGVFRSARPRS